MPDAGSRDNKAIGGDGARANRLLAVVRDIHALGRAVRIVPSDGGEWLPRRHAVPVILRAPPQPMNDTFEAALALRADARACIVRTSGEPETV